MYVRDHLKRLSYKGKELRNSRIRAVRGGRRGVSSVEKKERLFSCSI